MNNFENLNDDLFQKFEEDEITDISKIRGGISSSNDTGAQWTEENGTTWVCDGDALYDDGSLLAAWDCSPE